MAAKAAKVEAEVNSMAAMSGVEWSAAVKTVVVTCRQQAQELSREPWCNKSITDRLVS
jgi:hypothetical protein